MPRLSKRFIDQITPPAIRANGKPSQAFFRDSALHGFGLYVMSSGTKTFFVEKRVHGKVKRMNLGRYGELTPEQARNLAMQRLGAIAMGDDPSIKAMRDKSVTLQQAFADYLLARSDLKASTIMDYRRGIEGALATWCNKPLDAITKDMVEKRHRDLGRQSPARANNTMRVLRAVFNFAQDKYEQPDGSSLFPINPVLRLSRARSWHRVEARQRVIKPHELAAWYAAVLQLNLPVTRDFLVLLLLTGLRRSEAASLRWIDIDLVDNTLRIEDTKNRLPHGLPLSEPLVELLMRRREEVTSDVPWVFPSPVNESHLKEPKTAMAKVSELSGVEFALHDLRRTFVTTAESLDIPAYALKQLINHKNSSDVTAGYIIASAERLRAPMTLISNYLVTFMTSVR